jgi:hypothetical protein
MKKLQKAKFLLWTLVDRLRPMNHTHSPDSSVLITSEAFKSEILMKNRIDLETECSEESASL